MSQNTSNSTRQAALARRIALSASGKAALGKASTNRTAASVATSSAATYKSAPQNVEGGSARNAALARRIAMSKGGKQSVASTDRTRSAPGKISAAVISQKSNDKNSKDCGCGCQKESANTSAATVSSSNEMTMAAAPTMNHQGLVRKVKANSVRAAALSRRKALSSKGKTALKGGAVSAASAARASNPDMTSRELAKILRTERSTNGKTNKKAEATKPTGPRRRAAQDVPPKVGESDTASGQTVTGTMVDRTNDVTGTEASTCRGITGTEYMGADVFKDYCKTDAKPAFNRVSVMSTGAGNTVSGVKIGRSGHVTGDEPGSCKAVTGDEYLSAEQSQKFCGTSAVAAPSKFSLAETAKGKTVSGNNVGQIEKVTGNDSGADRSLTGTQYMQRGEDSAPAKVAVSQTLRGGSVTGQHVGRSENVTGDEPGTCRNVTGDDYVGSEQFDTFCKSKPAPTDRKVGMSNTLMGKSVTGTMTDRGGNITGNEAGTCKALSGTPYAGEAQTEAFCSSQDKAMAMARARKGTTNVGPAMTGIQPGINGVMTGNTKGACEPVSGTPYIGADQAAKACPATAATTNSPDFPQALGASGQPWGQFSVNSPAAESQVVAVQSGVTGSASGNSRITGPFGMASGKLTGTDDVRFGKTEQAVSPAMSIPATAEVVDGRVKSRISGEGMSSGIKISGDDWDRGEHVTGTEGTSATRRNPTRRGPTTVAMAADNKRNEEAPLPVSKVTGASGNTEKGSLITYSGGARG